MSSRNYPPQEIINHSLGGRKNYEQIILWMLSLMDVIQQR